MVVVVVVAASEAVVAVAVASTDASKLPLSATRCFLFAGVLICCLFVWCVCSVRDMRGAAFGAGGMPDTASRQARRLYVGNLLPDTTEDDLKIFFSKAMAVGGAVHLWSRSVALQASSWGQGMRF